MYILIFVQVSLTNKIGAQLPMTILHYISFSIIENSQLSILLFKGTQLLKQAASSHVQIIIWTYERKNVQTSLRSNRD